MITGVELCVAALVGVFSVEGVGSALADCVDVGDELIEAEVEIVDVLNGVPVFDPCTENVIDGDEDADCTEVCV